MSILRKLFTAIRGGAREMGESIADQNGVRIFEQEIKDAEGKIEKAKRDLTAVMAQEMQAARKVESLTADVQKHENFAAQALDKGDEALAMDIANKMVELQGELDIQTKAQESFAAHVTRLKGMIKQSTKTIADMQRQLVMVKTTESVQKATTAITDNYASGSSKLLTAKESLDRIKQRQQDLDDRLAAGDQLKSDLAGNDLESRLQAAGIGSTNSGAQDILAKLKAKKAG
ncbi:MAG: PspA/IM30 family protein [Ghiorsea sp.]|nr:PspA/IM30 family protein [Ghiorsea sp.]